MSEAHDPGEARASASEGAAKLPGASLSLKIALGLAPLGALVVAMFFWPDADFAIRRFGAKAPSAYIGCDFVNMYMGARAVLEGDVGRLFDAARYGAALHTLHPELDFHAWSYPPHLLLFVTLFGFFLTAWR